jgi:hypothetical protein
MQIRAGSAAQVAAALDKPHAQAGFGQSASRAHAGYAAADYGDGLLGFDCKLVNSLPSFNFYKKHSRSQPIRANPTARIASFSNIGTLARCEKTS